MQKEEERPELISLACTHEPKRFRMTFECKNAGDYILEICASCHDSESKDFLIKEEEIKG